MKFKLIEDATKKSALRAAMNTIKDLLKDKSLPAKTQEHLEALDGELKKTWEDMTSGGPDDNPENEPQGNSESMRESVTIGSNLEGQMHSGFTGMVDSMFTQGALTRDEYKQLLATVNDVMDAFASAVLDACPQLYDRSPWQDAPDEAEDGMMEAVFNEGKTEGGKDFPASDYAYVPDPEKPSTWKLRLTKTPGGDPDPGIVGAAAAALGKGFRGQKVQIPVGDLAKVKAKVRSAWKKANPDKSADDMPDGIKESAPLAESSDLQLLESDYMALSEGCVNSDGVATIKIIAPGWGSSGYYPAEVLERDGPKVFKAGLQQFWNHQTSEEEAARPEGDLDNLAGKLLEDARWDPNHPKGPGLYARAQIYDAYRAPVDNLGPDIGVSIRAMGRAQAGQAEGRQGAIIQEIAAAKSVDFVTKPGAGGAVLQLFESARHTAAHSQATQKGDPTMGEKELQEANAQLSERLARAEEKIQLREAGDFIAAQLKEAKLPEITKVRMAHDLVIKAPFKDGKLDEAALKATITAAIAAETAYLVEVTGGGRITGMGSAEPAAHKPEEDQASMKESYMALGYDEKIAAVMAKGR
jgi:hypothetical protein